MISKKKELCNTSDNTCEYIKCGIWCPFYEQRLINRGYNKCYDELPSFKVIEWLYKLGLIDSETLKNIRG